MTTWQLWAHLWRFDGFAWLVAGGLLFGYLLCFRAHDWHKLALFLTGLAIFLLATASPIAVLAQGTLFTAHVVQHVLLLLIVPPLWIMAIPSSTRTERSFARGRNRPLRHSTRPRGSRAEPPASSPSEGFAWPSLNWVAGLGVMWLWHAPTLCVAALRSRPLFMLQVASLLVAGVAFFWPVLRPNVPSRLSIPVSMIYLFTACLACTALGVLLSFSPLSACAAFAHPTPDGVVAEFRSQWGLSHALDQQIGGLVMWVPSCLVYLAITMVLTKRWFTEGAAIEHSGGSRGIGR